MRKTRSLLLGILTLVLAALAAPAAVQYWDPSTSAGYQHGDGNWSTNVADTNWNVSGGAGPRASWTNGNDAYFSGSNGASRVTLSNAVTAGLLTVDGGTYTLVITNGGYLSNSGEPIIGNGVSNNSMLVVGGSAVTSIWVFASKNAYLGGKTLSGTNTVLTVDGAGFPGSAVVSNSTVDTYPNLSIGAVAGDNSCGLNVVNGGRLSANAGNSTLNVGGNKGASNCFLKVDNGYVRIYGIVLGGDFADGMVKNGGQLYSMGGTIGANSASNCTLRITTNSTWDLGSQTLLVGSGGSVNSLLLVDNGGVVTNIGTSASYIGFGTNTLGVWASGNGVIVSNGGRFYLGGTYAYIGNGPGASNNYLIIDNAYMRQGAGTFSQGGNGANVTLRNGGQLVGSAWSIGTAGATSCTMRVLSGSTWDAGAGVVDLGASLNSISNLMLIDNGTVTNIGNGSASTSIKVGAVAGSTWNTLVITNNGKLFIGSVGRDAKIGDGCSSNTATIIGGSGVASLWDNAGELLMIGNGAAAVSNSLVIDGQGISGSAVMTNVGTLTVGSAALANGVVITNGGWLFTVGAATIGNAGSSGNYVRVEGGSVTSLWNAGNQVITVGSGIGAMFNTMTIDGHGVLGGAFVSNISQLLLGVNGFGGPAINNSLLVTNGGILYLGSGAHIVGGQTAANYYQSASNRLEIVQGGRVYSAGQLYIGKTDPGYQGDHHHNRVVIRDPDSLFDLGGASLTIGYLVGGGGAYYVHDNELWIEGGMVTNVGTITVSTGGGGALTSVFGNGLTLTNGGRLYSRGTVALGLISNSWGVITGTNSVWDLAGAALTVGGSAAYAINNTLTIDQGGTVDNIGTLTVIGALNDVNLRGGTLGLASTTYTNGLFPAGDGAQTNTLKALGGMLNFTAGLLINTNTTLTGIGTVGGGAVGVILTNGATLAPGLSGVGTLTIGGSNLTWNPGVTAICEITDMNLGPGVGWDLVNISSQLVLNGVGLGIKLVGAPANFDSAKDYNLKILSYGTQAGYATNTFTLNTNAFTGSAAPWTITNAANALWLIYRGGGAATGANLTWAVPSNGNWSLNANWAGGAAPGAGGSSTNVMIFGDNGTPYSSTNDYAGLFTNNQLQLSSVSSVTNYIRGTALVFTANGGVGARIDYLAGNNGGFTISNSVRLATDIEFGGNAIGGTLTLGGAVTNLGTLTKKGTWILALSNANNSFSGAVVVNSPAEGVLRLDNVNALNGSGPVTVSNGTLAVNLGAVSYYFANSQNNRRGLVTGSGSVWTNWGSAFSGFSTGATNVSFTIDGGKMVWNVRSVGFYSSQNSTAVVTNGGQLVISSSSAAMSYLSSNCTTLITGTNSILNCSSLPLIVSGEASGGAGVGNVLRIENEAMATNVTTVLVAGAGSSSNSLVVTNGGRLVHTGALSVGGGANASYNTFLLTGSNSLWVNGGGVYCGSGSGANSNSCLIDDGAMATNVRVILADSCSYNSLIIRNRGKLFSSASTEYIAYNANAVGNSILVTGIGSLWNAAGQTLNISTGNTNSLNRLTIEDGGMVTNVSTLTVAAGIGSSNNLLWVNGGKLYATSVAFNNPLVNSMQMDGAAEVALTSISITNANQSLSFNGGTLTVKNALVGNGLAQVVGDGAQTATLNGTAGGTNVFADGLLVSSNAALTGSGTVSGGGVYGVVLTNGSSLAAGGTNSVAALTLDGGVTWQGGMTLNVDVTNVAGGAGVGYDTVSILTPLVVNTNNGKIRIVLDSKGTAAGFSAANNYVLKLAGFAASSLDTNAFVVNTNQFTVGGAWSLEATPTALNYVCIRPAGPYLYVAVNGNDTAHTNWATAYTSLQDALDAATARDTICIAGQTFSNAVALNWTNNPAITSLVVRGGYAANTNDPALPGSNSPALWPTVITRAAANTRILNITGVTNGVLEQVTITRGYVDSPTGYGAGGVFISSCSDLAIRTCVITDNTNGISGSYVGNGGGIFSVGSSVTISNCVIRGNTAYGGNAQAGYGGGLYLQSGTLDPSSTVIGALLL